MTEKFHGDQPRPSLSQHEALFSTRVLSRSQPMTDQSPHAITDEREARVAAYRAKWGCGDELARIMLALISCGMVDQDSAEDDPEMAADLYSALLNFGLDTSAIDWRTQR